MGIFVRVILTFLHLGLLKEINVAFNEKEGVVLVKKLNQVDKPISAYVRSDK